MTLLPRFIRHRLAHRPMLTRIVDNVGWQILDHVFRLGFGFFVWIWIARYLGPEQFGSLNYAVAYVAIFTVLTGLGLENIILRELVRGAKDEPIILATSAFMILLAGVFSFLFSLALFHVLGLGDDAIWVLVLILALPLLFRSLDAVYFVMAAKLQYKYIVLTRCLTFSVFLIIKIIILMMGMSVNFIALAMSGEIIIGAIGIAIVYWYRGGLIVGRFVSRHLATQFFRQSFPLLLSGLSWMIYWRIDQIMIGEMVGSDEVGIYSMATKISEVWYFIPSALIVSLAPSVIKTKMHDNDLYIVRLKGLFAFIIWLSVAVSCACTILAPTIVPILLGESYLGVTPILVVHIWGSIFVFMGGVSLNWYVNENLTNVFLYRNLSGAIINVALNFILLPKYGGLGAAIATIISLSCVGFFLDAFSRKTRSFFLIKLQAFNPFASVRLIRHALASR